MKAYTPEQKRELAEQKLVKTPKTTRTTIGRREMLTVKNADPDFHYSVVNDYNGRVEAAKELGYEVVISDDVIGDSSINNPSALGSVSTKAVGHGVTGVLMRVPKENYSRNQVIKQKEVTQSVDALRQAPDGLTGTVSIS